MTAEGGSHRTPAESMPLGEPLGGLNEGEAVRTQVRPSPWSTPYIIGYFLGVITLFFLIGVIILVVTELYRRGHKYHVTSQRAVKEVTFLSRTNDEAPYQLISNITFNQSLTARIFGFGDVVCKMASGDTFTFRGVPDPGAFKAALSTAKQTDLDKPVRTIDAGDGDSSTCHECGRTLDPDVRFCPDCGARVA